MNTIKFCLKCGHPVGPEDKFCLGCGANIADMQAQQGAGSVGGDAATQNTVNTQATQNTVNTVNTVNTQNTQGGFQQPQGGAGFQPQQNNFYSAQPQAGFGAPGAAVKSGDNWFKKNLKLIIIIAAALVLCIVGFFVIKHIFFRFQKIDAKDLIKVKFSGIETAGTATAKLNKYSDSVYDAEGSVTDAYSDYDLGDVTGSSDDDNSVSAYFELSGKRLQNAWSKAGDAAEARKMRDALLSESAGLKILVNGEETNKATGLKNGDKVTIKLEFNESYLKDNNIKIENAEFEVEAEGLKTGTKVELFKDFDVKFTGNDGAGRAQMNTDNTQPYVRYSFKEGFTNGKLKNGDKVTVVARLRSATPADSDDPQGPGFVQYDGNYYTAEKIVEEKEFTVEGLQEMTKIDVFENVKLEYRYAVPYLRVSKVNTDACSDVVKNGVRFYVDSGSDVLKVGDKVKIKAYPKNSFTEAGNIPAGEPDEDGYYVKEITIGDDAPAYLTKDSAPANLTKFNTYFEAATKDLTTKGVDRTYISGFSAGGKISAMAFKETKTYLMENNEASNSSIKAYLAKTYTVTVTTDKGTKTAFGLILMRNPIVEGDVAKVEMYEEAPNYTAYVYEKEEDIKSRLESLNKNYSQIEVTASAPATTEKPAETTTKAEEKKPEETTTTKAA